jgi:transcriptional regulator with XRE-family HTH domain
MKELHLFDLPNELRIQLKTNYREKLFDLAYKKFKTTAKLAELMNLEPCKLRLLKNGKVNPTIVDLKNLLSTLNISNFDELEKNIKSIRLKKGYINDPKLPFDLSSNIGTVIGGVLGDGGITGKYCRLFYSNTNEKLVNIFIDSVKSIFGDVKFKISHNVDGVKIVTITSIVGKILLKIFNLPRGDKTLINYELPKLFFNANDKNLVRNFLRQIFADEGCVHKNGNITFSTSIEKCALNRN